MADIPAEHRENLPLDTIRLRLVDRKFLECLIVAAVLISPTVLRADDSDSASKANRQGVSERIERLRSELANDMNNRLITTDQYSAEITKLDQLKIQEHADASQNNGQLTNDQRSMYSDLLSQIQRDIDQMLEAATPQPSPSSTSTNTVAIPYSGDNSARKEGVRERLQRLRLELTNDLNNHLITADQFHAELTKLDQLKIQEHADASQDNLKGEQSMYNDALNQIQQDIDQMLEANSAPPPAQ